MTATRQPSLFEEPGAPPPSPARVRALAGVLAGFAWPGGSLAKLGAKKQELAEQTAADALATLTRATE